MSTYLITKAEVHHPACIYAKIDNCLECNCGIRNNHCNEDRKNTMNHEIRYRVWDKITKKMYPVQKIAFDDFGFVHEVGWFNFHSKYPTGEKIFRSAVGHEVSRTLEVMQYTGLKDKKGKDIYEGDIVQVLFRGRRGSKIVVEYEIKTASFVPISNLRNVYGESDPKFYEVVGNKYENPELL